MAKRLTDSDKWRRSFWYRRLPPLMKLLWVYICDTCDHAGVWLEDLELASQEIGATITKEDLVTHFGDKMLRVDEHRLFFPAFIEFQYGSLDRQANVIKSVRSTLEKRGIDPSSLTLMDENLIPLGSHPDGYKEKERIKEKEWKRGIGGKTIDRAVLAECVAAWQKTLDRYEIRKSATSDEEVIAQLIQRKGPEKTALALLGAGYEARGPTYNPSEHCRITRLLKPDIFELLVNLGSKARRPARVVHGQEAGSC